MRYPAEPFRIKMVEPVFQTTLKQREEILKQAKYNIFRVPSNKILVDLLTDSGTGTMSQEQWAAMMLGDEAYANARSWQRFEAAVQEFTGMKHVIPVHQGRAGEKIIAAAILKPNDKVVSNTLFDTTRANIEFVGGQGVDLPCPEARDIYSDAPFKGNIDLDALEGLLKKGGVRAVLLTLTNNTGGGQPVSYENCKQAAELARQHRALFWIDACRVAENAFLAKQKDPSLSGKTIPEIIRDYLQLADLISFSAKKDAIANIGGFVATNDHDMAAKFKEFLILWEGFPTYGGLAGRDLEAVAQGLKEVVDEAYLAHRTGQVAYLAQGLRDAGFPVIWPPGGHAAYVEAGQLLPHIPREQFPGHALVVEFYRQGAVRGVEIGTMMFKQQAKHELMRFAVPRRSYTQAHIDHVIETGKAVIARKNSLPGYRISYEPPFLRHFLSELEPVN